MAEWGNEGRQGHGGKYKDVDSHGRSIKKKYYLHLMSSKCLGNRQKTKRNFNFNYIHLVLRLKLSQVSHMTVVSLTVPVKKGSM